MKKYNFFKATLNNKRDVGFIEIIQAMLGIMMSLPITQLFKRIASITINNMLKYNLNGGVISQKQHFKNR